MEVLQRTANRGSISTGGYEVENSCKFEPDNSESMSRTPSGNGNLQICTVSFWLKITELNKSHMIFTGDYGGTSPWFVIGTINDRIYFSSTAGVSDSPIVPTRVFRDTSAWYHLVFAIDTTQGTAADRVKIYVNGVQETVFTTTNYPSQNDNLEIMAAKAQGIGGYNDGTDYRFAGYLSEFVAIDGQALAPTEFGEFDADSGIWKPIDVSGLTFGTNGFYLDFKDSANLGNDASGGLDFTETNLTAADQATDTPTNNFATFNPLNPTYGASVISEGGTKAQGSGQNTFDNIQSTIAVTKGKWYCELEPQVDSAARNTAFGVVNLDTASFSGDHYGAAGFWSAGFDDGRLAWHFYNGGGAGTETVNYGTGAGDTAGTIGMAFDLDNGTLKFYIRNTQLSISASSIPAGTYAFFGDVMGTAAPYLNFNFGGYTVNSISSAESDANGYGTFEYAPPSGYYALCTKNLAEYG